MKTKRKSLGEVLHDIVRGEFTWDCQDKLEKVGWALMAKRIRREVIKRELEKAEDSLGLRQLHDHTLAERRVEQATSAVILGKDNT